MDELVSAVLMFMRIVVLSLALGLTLVSYQSYRRQPTDRLKDAFVGFAFLSIGVAVTTVGSQIWPGVAVFGIIETVPFIGGFGMLYLSLYR